MTNKKWRLAFLVIFSLSVFFTRESEAERTILSIRVKGNQTISEPTILSKIRTKSGEALSETVINNDIKRLYALGYFTDVTFDVEDHKGGAVVTIIVEEKPVIKEIIFEGNKRFSAQRLRKLLKTKKGDMLSFGKLSDDIAEIKTFYERNGFYRAGVKHKLDKERAANEVTVRMIVDEKVRMRVKRVFIKGNKSVKSKTLLKLMQTRPAWFFRRGYFDDSSFETDLEAIKTYYENSGFLDMAVTSQFDYKEEGVMHITLVIDEGNRYDIDKIVVKGRKVIFPASLIEEKISLKEGTAFSYSTLRQDVNRVRSLYYREGYMNADIAVDRILKPKTHKLDIIFDIDA
ncbi:MAG: hypothetical protein NG740_05320, partial [Omnitrophica bacterium]|nr:hypothetical protein [Candidatus Omnitrophota bacterium]